MTSQTYTVTGMTCAHCVDAVTEEVQVLPGVTDVRVDLATSRLIVMASTLLDDAAVAAAVDEAGYTLTMSD